MIPVVVAQGRHHGVVSRCHFTEEDMAKTKTLPKNARLISGAWMAVDPTGGVSVGGSHPVFRDRQAAPNDILKWTGTRDTSRYTQLVWSETWESGERRRRRYNVSVLAWCRNPAGQWEPVDLVCLPRC